MTVTRSSVKEVIPDVGGDFELDQGVIAELPEGSTVVEASSFGTSAWTRTARIRVQLSDGSQKAYFLKCATQEGRVMMEGEFNSMNEIYKLLPSFVPKPHAWGRFKLASPVTHFFLCDFLDISNDMPDPVRFAARVAELHRISKSPTGKFGFHVPNCHGKIRQTVEWNISWASFYTKLLTSFFHTEIDVNGTWPEYERVFEEVVTHVIPQLLEPLQSNGRVLKPCLVHGDLWEENTATDLETGEPVVFDSSAFYAHNEYELGMWRREIIKFGQPYFSQYLRYFRPSEPVGQWDDRIRLYSIKFNLAHMIGWPGAPVVRGQIYNDMCYLVHKYPPKASLNESSEEAQAEQGHNYDVSRRVEADPVSRLSEQSRVGVDG